MGFWTFVTFVFFCYFYWKFRKLYKIVEEIKKRDDPVVDNSNLRHNL